MTTSSDIIIYTDGGARGNPGPAGAGAVIFDGAGKRLAEISEFLGTQTNNFAEYEAVVLALKRVAKHFGKDKSKKLHVEVRMDSELVCKQLNGVYQIKEPSLFSHFIAIHNLRVTHFPHSIFVHVRREKNKEADRLANEAMDKGE